jgi:hypothetical protein
LGWGASFTGRSIFTLSILLAPNGKTVVDIDLPSPQGGGDIYVLHDKCMYLVTFTNEPSLRKYVKGGER